MYWSQCKQYKCSNDDYKIPVQRTEHAVGIYNMCWTLRQKYSKFIGCFSRASAFQTAKMYVFNKIFFDSVVARRTHKLGRANTHTHSTLIAHCFRTAPHVSKSIRFLSFLLRLFIFIFVYFCCDLLVQSTQYAYVCLVCDCMCACVRLLKNIKHTRRKVIIRIFMASYSACLNFFYILFARIFKRSPSSCQLQRAYRTFYSVQLICVPMHRVQQNAAIKLNEIHATIAASLSAFYSSWKLSHFK